LVRSGSSPFPLHSFIHIHSGDCPGKLLYSIHHPSPINGRPLVQSERNQYRQRHPLILLPRPSHHVFHPRVGEQTARLEMGVYDGVYRVWGYHDLYDCPFLLVSPLRQKRETNEGGWQISAFLLAFKGIQNISKDSNGQALSASALFGDPIFRNIVLSLLATLGLYVIASLIFVRSFPLFFFFFCCEEVADVYMYQFEPWHLITSFIQYLLMAPSYISVLNVYAVRSLPSLPPSLHPNQTHLVVLQRPRRILGHQRGQQDPNRPG
jgi:hypothetical protein